MVTVHANKLKVKILKYFIKNTQNLLLDDADSVKVRLDMYLRRKSKVYCKFNLQITNIIKNTGVANYTIYIDDLRTY
jgi:hypothetical protein